MVDGLKNLDEGFIPPVFTDNDGFDLLDRSKIVGPRESIEWTRRLTEVGIFAGISSGAIMAAAVKCAAEIDEGVIVTIVCDGGWKYLSTGRLDRRHRRGHRAGQAGHLLLSGPVSWLGGDSAPDGPRLLAEWTTGRSGCSTAVSAASPSLGP